MGEYISKKKVCKILTDLMTESGTEAKIMLSDAMQDVSDEPSADVVEVVRCGECKWYDWVDCMNPTVTAFPNGVRDEDNYCNFGERKDGDKE